MLHQSFARSNRNRKMLFFPVLDQNLPERYEVLPLMSWQVRRRMALPRCPDETILLPCTRSSAFFTRPYPRKALFLSGVQARRLPPATTHIQNLWREPSSNFHHSFNGLSGPLNRVIW